MNIQKFVDKILKNIFPKENIQTVYKGINIYFGSLDYFYSCRIDEGIIIFWEDAKLIISPIFTKKNKICSTCFLEHRQLFKKSNDFWKNCHIQRIDGNSFCTEKLIYLISQLVQTVSNSPMFPYFIFEGDKILEYNFFRISNCDECILEELNSKRIFTEKQICQASSLRGNLKDYSFYIQLDNVDSGIFNKELTTVLGEEIVVELQYSIFEGETISGIGIDKNYNKAKAKAFLESMERYSGIFSKGSKRLFLSMNDLTTLGINFFNPNRYLFYLEKEQIDEKEKIYWISAYSYEDKRIFLVPEDFIIYKSVRTDTEKKIVNVSSNGHAIGNSYSEAVIFSLFELYERDYFLFHWYKKKAPKELNQESIFDKEILHYLRLLKELGYSVSIYQLLDNEVISIYWTLARGISSDKFATYSTAGAHLFGKSAIISALKELYFALYIYDKNIENIKYTGRKMVLKDIKTVADHAIYYSIEDRYDCFKFLEKSEIIDFVNLDDYEINMREYYYLLLEYTNNKFGNIYISDNTPIGLREIGLFEIKVFVPGMQDMSFGYTNQYINKRRICIDDNKNILIHPFP